MQHSDWTETAEGRQSGEEGAPACLFWLHDDACSSPRRRETSEMRKKATAVRTERGDGPRMREGGARGPHRVAPRYVRTRGRAGCTPPAAGTRARRTCAAGPRVARGARRPTTKRQRRVAADWRWPRRSPCRRRPLLPPPPPPPPLPECWQWGQPRGPPGGDPRPPDASISSHLDCQPPRRLPSRAEGRRGGRGGGGEGAGRQRRTSLREGGGQAAAARSASPLRSVSDGE